MKVHCAFDQMVSVSELKSHPKNRNKHPDGQIARLADILSYQGFRYPVKVSKQSGFVTSGHGRILAAKKNGWAEVPVSFQDYDDEIQEYADVQSDNAIAAWAELDLSGINLDALEFGDALNIDMLGLANFQVIEPEVIKPKADEDEVGELPEEPKTKRGDIYILGRHRLMCGDSTSVDDVEKLMGPLKADMVFTDPPYGVAVNNTQGAILGDGDLQVFRDCLPLLKAYSKDNAHFYVWCAAGDMLPPSLAAFVEVFTFQNLLPIRVTHENKRGKKAAFKMNYEVCLFGNDNTKAFRESKKFAVSETTMNDSRYEGSGFLRVYPALWDGERATEHNMNIVHPTQKKVEMIEFYVEISSAQDELVLDLFGGSGSTMLACEKQGRVNRSMELDPKYCDVIVNRWEKYTGQTAQLLGSDA